jgi:cellulose biosynthesis protein BcsQ
MKIQLLIAIFDRDYADHLSGVLTEKHAESFEVTVCSAAERLDAILAARMFDVALFDSALISANGYAKVRVPLLLSDGTEAGTEADSDGTEEIVKIRKYRRISRISGDILEEFAKVAVGTSGLGGGKASVTAVWAPAGGVGKTTVALAYAAQKAASGSAVTYLDLEYFSSTSVYFTEQGKSISTAFEKLGGGNVALLLKAIALKDAGSGIFFFSPPTNYDDMNELTEEDIEILVAAASENSDELIIDLPSVCDERCRRVFEKADAVFLVADGGKTSLSKLQQFAAQHNLFEKIRAKTVLIANKGARVNDTRYSRTVNLPAVSSADPITVYKTLSGVSFD